MDKQFLQQQKEHLLALKDVILNGGKVDKQENTSDEVDLASTIYDMELALSMVTKERNALWEIDQALQKIENGTYGICEMSGKEIGRERLEALPYARFTVECKAQLEKENKYSNSPNRYSQVQNLFNSNTEEADDTEDNDEEEEE